MKLILVDKENNRIGYEHKDVVHKEHLLHRSVHGFVMNKDKKLLCRKISEKNRPYPGHWSTGIGAHVHEEENEEEVLKRICKEFAVDDKEVKLVGNICVDDEYEHEISPVYLIKGDKLPTPQHPIIGYEFFSVEEIEQLKKKTTHLEKSLQLFLENNY